jgi:hypothetical protein
MPETTSKVTYQAEKCPMCVDGRIFHAYMQDFDDCPLCKGTGLLIRDYICACGAPVSVVSKDSYLYCGNDVCLKHLRDDAEEAKRPATLGYNTTGTYRGWHKGWSGYNERFAE